MKIDQFKYEALKNKHKTKSYQNLFEEVKYSKEKVLEKFFNTLESNDTNPLTMVRYISKKEQNFLEDYYSGKETTYENPTDKINSLIDNVIHKKQTNEKKEEILLNLIGSKEEYDINELVEETGFTKKTIYTKIGQEQER